MYDVCPLRRWYTSSRFFLRWVVIFCGYCSLGSINGGAVGGALAAAPLVMLERQLEELSGNMINSKIGFMETLKMATTYVHIFHTFLLEKEIVHLTVITSTLLRYGD